MFTWLIIPCWTFSKWLVVWWGGKNAFVLSNYQLKLLPHSAVQHATLRDESIEILSASRHYQRGNVTHFQHMTFRIYTQKKGGELSLSICPQEQIKFKIWCGVIYHAVRFMLYCHVRRTVALKCEKKKSISNSSVDKEELSRIALRLELRNHDSEDVIPHPNTNWSQRDGSEKEIYFLSPHAHVHSHSSICRNRKMSAQRFPISPVCCLLLRLMTKHRTAAGSTGGQPS